MLYYSDYLNKDSRFEAAVLYYLLNAISKNNEEVSMEDVFWIINRANFRACEKYWTPVIDYNFLNWLGDIEYKLEVFNVDWNKDTFKNTYTHLDFLSQSQTECLDKAIFRYKLYGKYIIKNREWVWKLKDYLKKVKKKWLEKC